MGDSDGLELQIPSTKKEGSPDVHFTGDVEGTNMNCEYLAALSFLSSR